MTSKVSNKKFSPIQHNFMCGVKSKTKIAIILFILHLAAAPAVVISLIASVYCKEPGEYVEIFASIGIITTALAGFLGIFIAIDSFSCLHNKSVVDMRLSLPLTADQRFFSNFLSGFAVYIVPFLGAQVVSMLGMAYGFIFMEGREFERSIGYNEQFGIQYVPYECDYFSYAMPALLKLILAGILVMLMLYTLTVLVTVCCGSKFESIAYTILINAAIPLTIYLVFMSMFSELFGVYMGNTIAKLIMHTSPAGGILAALQLVLGEVFTGAEINLPVWAVIYFLITAAMGAGAFFLYRKRRAEQVSKPFAFKLIYHIISTAAVFCIYSVFYYERSGIVAAILITLIAYIILEFAANRGFKKVWLSLIKYAGAMGASVLIIFIAQKTEGFGMVTRVPDISQVKSVSLAYGGFYQFFNSYAMYGVDDTTLTFNEKENIETIIAAHKGTVEKREEHNVVGGGFKVTYELKGGGKLTRIYDDMPVEEAEIMGRLDLTDEYKQQVAEKHKEKILSVVKDYRYKEEYNDYEAMMSYKTTLYSLYVVSPDAQYESSIGTGTLIDKNFYEQLAEAYAADIMNINEENYYRSDAKDVFKLDNQLSHFAIYVPGSFVNTLELCERFGFEIKTKGIISDEDSFNALLHAVNNHSVSIFTAEEVRRANKVPDNVPLHARNVNDQIDYTHWTVNSIDNDLLNIYRACEPMNIVPDNGYIIYVFGRAAVVPEELNGAAERVYAGRVEPDGYDEYGNPFWSYSTDLVPTVEAVPTGTTAYTIDNNG